MSSLIVDHNAEVGDGTYLSSQVWILHTVCNIPGYNIRFLYLDGHRNIDAILNLTEFASVISSRF